MMQISAVGEKTLTFAIPPGQLKFSPPAPAPRGSAHEESGGNEPLIDNARQVTATMDTSMTERHAAVMDETDSNAYKSSAQEHKLPDDGGLHVRNVQPLNEVTDTSTEGHEPAGKDETDGDGLESGVQQLGTLSEGMLLADGVQPVNAAVASSLNVNGTPLDNKDHDKDTESGTQEMTVTNVDFKNGGLTLLPDGLTNDKTSSKTTSDVAHAHQKSESEPPESPMSVIHHEIASLKQLMDKAIEIDGRLDPRDRKAVAAASPWKYMRVKRKNQDLGTLFEMREEFYAYKLPKITKRAKR